MRAGEFFEEIGRAGLVHVNVCVGRVAGLLPFGGGVLLVGFLLLFWDWIVYDVFFLVPR